MTLGGHGVPAVGESPEWVRTSLAAAMTLGLKPGRFHRGARLGCLNLLLTYTRGCTGRCSYCGLARDRRVEEGGRTFIRVGWPAYPLDRILERARQRGGGLRRVCVSMVTRPGAFDDALRVIRRARRATGLAVSALVAPTALPAGGWPGALRRAGADCVGVAVDAATPELFERHRGRGVGGAHRWDRYWEAVAEAAAAFGRGRVSVHLIVGLGETEQEMVGAIQRARDAGAVPHLFSFFPEPGSRLARQGQPPVGRYRRIQVARHLIVEEGLDPAAMAFDGSGRIVSFGADVGPLLRDGAAFMTSGCPGPDGDVACNRPYGNERPGGVLYNYPFRPGPADLAAAARELGPAGAPGGGA